MFKIAIEFLQIVSYLQTIVLGGDLKIVNKGVPGEAQDLQTEADRSAQYFIEKSLQQKFNNRLKIIGEEVCFNNKL